MDLQYNTLYTFHGNIQDIEDISLWGTNVNIGMVLKDSTSEHIYCLY